MENIPTWAIWAAIGVLFIIWFLYVTRASGDHGSNVFGRLHRAQRRTIFWLGDIRKIHHFPYVTWDAHCHSVEYQEASMILSKCKAGDVGIHRDKGYLSNFGIPGFMKHAWIHTTDGTELTQAMIVEAISDGVVKRHGLFPIRSDYTIILRPKQATPEETERAVKKANSIVGCNYDASFEFDIEEEIDLFKQKYQTENVPGAEMQEDQEELDIAQKNMRAEWDGGFSCTETISFAWWHLRRPLRLFRQKARGKDVILADQLINGGWEIIAMSDSVTKEVALKLGLGEEGMAMITEYRNKHGYNLEENKPKT